MWVLLTIWIAGGFASLGILNGIIYADENTKSNFNSQITAFLKSWYAFGFMIGILINEINDLKND
jgi:hypothetical protein